MAKNDVELGQRDKCCPVGAFMNEVESVSEYSSRPYPEASHLSGADPRLAGKTSQDYVLEILRKM